MKTNVFATAIFAITVLGLLPLSLYAQSIPKKTGRLSQIDFDVPRQNAASHATSAGDGEGTYQNQLKDGKAKGDKAEQVKISTMEKLLNEIKKDNDAMGTEQRPKN